MQVTPDGKGLFVGIYPEGSDDLQLVRIDAETVRDTALAISGLLVEKPGGRSVKP